MSVQAQVSPIGCNNQTRTLQQAAGYSGVSSQTCSQLTITVGGQSFQTPASCQQGYAYYAGTVYSCGPASTGTNCKADGDQVNITLATEGACPDITGLNPGTWTSWASVPAAITAAMRCKAPKIEMTFDWSATVKSCTIWEPPEGVGGVQQGGSGESYSRVFGDPTGTLSESTWNPLVGPYELAQTGGGSSLPASLRAGYTAYAAIHGVDLTAQVGVEHSGGGHPTSSNVYEISGRVLGDGRFDLTSTVAFRAHEEDVVRVQRLRHDGRALFIITSGSEEASVYDGAYANRDRVFSMAAPFAAPLHTWVSNPFEFALFDNSNYEALEPDGSGAARVARRIGTGPDSIVSEVYAIAEATAVPPRVVGRSTLDLLGRVRQHSTQGEPMQLADGSWRSRTFVQTDYLDGTSDGRKCTITTTIRRAVPVSPGTALPEASFSPEQVWNVWR